MREDTCDGWTFYRTPMAEAVARSSSPLALVRQMRATARRIRELIANEQPDVIHANQPQAAAAPGLVDALRVPPDVQKQRDSVGRDCVKHHQQGPKDQCRHFSEISNPFRLRPLRS